MLDCGGGPTRRLGRLCSMGDSQSILNILPLLISHMYTIAIMIDNINRVSRFHINGLLLCLLGHIRLLLDDFGRCVLLVEILSNLMN
jgi:hypothetical protein